MYTVILNLDAGHLLKRVCGVASAPESRQGRSSLHFSCHISLYIMYAVLAFVCKNGMSYQVA